MASVLLYGGKGGVGKTTCAAATALATARDGASTLVVSTDPAHSLSDVFETTVESTPTRIRPCLDALAVDPATGLDTYRAVFERLTADLSSAGLSVSDEELTELFTSGLLPGSDELAALDQLATVADTAEYDQVVVDTAPTGHTLRLLDLPDAVGTGVRTARSIGQQVRRKTAAARTMLFGPYARRRDDDDRPFQTVLEDLETVRALLSDPERTEFRVVCLPEQVVLAETERLVAQLRAADVPVQKLVVNRLIEDEPGGCSRCRARWESQQSAVDEIGDRFPDLEASVLPDLTGQARGIEAVERLADRVTRP